MVRTDEPSGLKILILAIALSFVWHIFWLFSVKIVSAPIRQDAVKFSKVSFLGPILSSISMEVRAAPASRSFLERRYRVMAVRSFSAEARTGAQPASKDAGDAPSVRSDGPLSAAIDDAVSGEKLEPDYPVE
jgi:hypothetical protein